MSTARRPNVLVVMSDEQSWNTLGVNGNPASRTPHLDALAADGTQFDRAYTPFALCCPSRTSLHTAMMPRHHHVLGNWRGINPALRSTGLARWFADAGHHTFHVGKWHVPGTTPARMGFADQRATPAVLDGKDRGRYITEYREHVTARGYELVPDHIENLTPADVATLADPASPHRGRSEVAVEDYLEVWQTEQFADALAAAPTDRPWFGVCSYNAPHFPLLAPAPYDTMINRDEVQLPASWDSGVETRPAEVQRSKFATKYADLDHAGWVDTVAHYLGLVALVDDQVGRLVAMLAERGELDNTIIVFTSDHGDMMGAHRLMEKGHLLPYEEATHIPLLIKVPGVTGGQRSSELMSMIDVAPTLLELAGVDVPPGLDGRSMAQLITGQGTDNDATPPTGRRYVMTESVLWSHDSEDAHGEHLDPTTLRLPRDAINLSVRDHRYRYIHRSDDREELYDLRTDPGEVHDVSAAHPEVVRAHRSLLAAEVADTWPAVAATLSGH